MSDGLIFLCIKFSNEIGLDIQAPMVPDLLARGALTPGLHEEGIQTVKRGIMPWIRVLQTGVAPSPLVTALDSLLLHTPLGDKIVLPRLNQT